MSSASVALVVRAVRDERPPDVTLLVDARLTNAADRPRWFLMPAQLPVMAAAGFEVDGVELHDLGVGGGRLGHFRGGRPFFGVRIASRGQLTLGSLPIVAMLTDPPPVVLAVETVIADGAIVEGDSLEVWVGAQAVSAGGGAVRVELGLPQDHRWANHPPAAVHVPGDVRVVTTGLHVPALDR